MFTEHETLQNDDFVLSLVDNSTLSLVDDLENVIPLILIIDEFWTFVLFAKANVPTSINASAKNTFFIFSLYLMVNQLIKVGAGKIPYDLNSTPIFCLFSRFYLY